MEVLFKVEITFTDRLGNNRTKSVNVQSTDLKDANKKGLDTLVEREKIAYSGVLSVNTTQII